MTQFSLSNKQNLPTAIDGYAIWTDFNLILRILRMLNDSEISDADKPMLLRKMFFKGDAPTDADAAFARFLHKGDNTTLPGGERDFDYEQDAQEIYSAFWQTYQIDLFNVKMHWWQFSALFDGLFATENALSSKVRLRHLDDSDGKKKTAIARSKEAAKLREAVSRADKAFEKQIAERLKKGLPIGDLMEEAKRNA